MKTYLNSAAPVPHALTLTLCWLFAVLFGVWLLPNTVFTRNVCLIAGALLGLLVVVPHWRLLLQKRAIPIWLICGFFLWITFHLFFIGPEYATQLEEYTKSWKKIFISSVFAVGLGMAIASNFQDSKRLEVYWRVIYFGLLLPMLIYFVKLGATAYSLHFGIELSPHLIISREIFTDPFAIHRSGYVFFVMPALAIAIAKLAYVLKNRLTLLKSNGIYWFAVAGTSLLFYVENDRLAYIFFAILIFVAAIPVMRSWVCKASTIKAFGFLVLTLFAIGAISFAAYRQNAQWDSFFADAKMAVQVERYDNWKYTPEYLPVNELGQKASDSNYKRIAWLIVGTRLTLENPLGYGLMSQSFGRIGKLKWPDSQMSWSHSAWLDITLGYGFPALILFAGAVLLAWKSSRILPIPWVLVGRWGLGALTLVFMFKEVSSEVYINAFIFLVLFAASLNCGLELQSLAKEKKWLPEN